MDDGPEFISLALASWAEEQGVPLEFIKPETPAQNSYIERFLAKHNRLESSNQRYN